MLLNPKHKKSLRIVSAIIGVLVIFSMIFLYTVGMLL